MLSPTSILSAGTRLYLNRTARSLQYLPYSMIFCTCGQPSRSKSMSHSQLVSPVKYFRLMASTMTSTVQGFSAAAI